MTTPTPTPISATPTTNIVVFGGTGDQGSSFLRAMAAYNTPQTYTMHVLSRNVAAGASTRLASILGVRIVEAAEYADHPVEAFGATGLGLGEVDVVFVVLGYMPEEKEVVQGKGIIDAAVEYAAKHVVFMSAAYPKDVKRGDDGMDAKRAIDAHLVASGLPYTILRDTDFMDNWLDPTRWIHKVYRTMLLRYTFLQHPHYHVPLISLRDIGRAAARAVVCREDPAFRNREIVLVGDNLTAEEIGAACVDVTGKSIVEEWGFVTRLMMWAVPAFGAFAKNYDAADRACPVEKTRAVLPDVENFRAFLVRCHASDGL